MTATVSGAGKPQLIGGIVALPGELGPFVVEPQADFTPAADPHVQQLVGEVAALKAERDRAVVERDEVRAERDQLLSVNARISRKLAALRDGVAVLAERIKERE